VEFNNNFRHLENILPSLLEKRDAILEAWTADEKTQAICHKRGINSTEMTKNVALLVISNIYDLIKPGNKADYQYDIEVLVRYFNDNLVQTDEICTLYLNLQNYLIQNILTLPSDQLNDSQGIFFELNQIFDYNLSNVLSVFNALKNELKLLQEREGPQGQDILEYYKTVVDQVCAVIVTDTQGNITFVNDRFCELSGYTRSYLLSTTANVVRHLDSPKAQFKDMWDTLNSKKTWVGELKNFTEAGNAYYVNCVISPILDNNGSVKEIIAIQRDITVGKQEAKQLKKHNEQEENRRLSTFIDAQGSELVATIPLPSFIINSDDDIVDYNDAFFNLFNLEKHAELLKDLQEKRLSFRDLLDKRSLKRFEGFTEDWMTLYSTLYSNEPLMMKCEVDFITEHYEIKVSQFKGIKTLVCLVRV